ncbi:hypothetical protein BIW11_13960 [Tropilaelaps mercedesae]|uniref:Uncharacterized protein n=1 Tax=Tropilaelaps mercedesae TaxID=418985 RepID=A0A1V9WZP3_9ACAR|nr:hypothetical protein BIW11_13960 [Tropilaelaps mercedesae]
MWMTSLVLCGAVLGLCSLDPLYPSESDPNFMKLFERKYSNLLSIDQNRCLQKLTCILAKNQTSFEDPVIANIVRDFETLKNIRTNSPAYPFLAAYQTGLSKQRCDKVYPECPIGFVADERPLDDDDEEVAGVIDDQQPSIQQVAKDEEQLL